METSSAQLGVLRTFRSRGAMNSPYSTERLKHQCRLIFILSLVLCIQVITSMACLQIPFFFLLMITTSPMQKILLPNSGPGSVPWQCFSCFDLYRPPFYTSSKAWVTGDTQEPFVPFSPFFIPFWGLNQLLLSPETCTATC